MKKLFLIGGTMVIGKSTMSQFLKCKLPNSVYLENFPFTTYNTTVGGIGGQ